MNISDFTFKRRLIKAPFFEVLMTNKEGTCFGLIYSAAQQMPDELVFAEFERNPLAFFIEAEVISSEITVTTTEQTTQTKNESNPKEKSDGK